MFQFFVFLLAFCVELYKKIKRNREGIVINTETANFLFKWCRYVFLERGQKI